MIRDTVLWKRFEADWQRSRKPDLEKHLHIFDALLEHARTLGIWPPEEPLEGLEHDLYLAKVINAHGVESPDPAGTGPG